jgi:preprotein translocase subunit YajC
MEVLILFVVMFAFIIHSPQKTSEPENKKPDDEYVLMLVKKKDIETE